MGERFFVWGWIAIAIVTTPTLLNAATIKISDGSVLIGEIENRSSDLYTIRMKNGARVNIRSCDIIEVVDNGNVVALEEPEGHSVLKISGSNTLGAKLIPAMVENYLDSIGAQDKHWSSHKQNEKILEVGDARRCTPRKIEIKAHGSSTAFHDLGSGQADVGMSSRQIKPDELLSLASLGDLTEPNAEHVVTLDGVAVIVHPDNPIQSLTRDGLAKIFSGETKDWSEVNGEPAPINIYARGQNSGTYDTFNTLVLKERTLSSSAKLFESNTELSDSVINDPYGIGFLGLAFIRDAKPLAINECELLYHPTSFDIKTEEYPLVRRLYLYIPTHSPSVLAKDFLQVAVGEIGQQVANKEGFVDLSIKKRSESDQVKMSLYRMKASLENVQNSSMLKEYLDTVEGATRLSATFHFRDGSSRLDNRALSDIKRLADYLKNGDDNGKQVLLLGFSDTRGEYQKNIKLSLARASSVANQLTWNGVRDVSVKGFGEELPVACNNSIQGFNKNRRVETWIK